MSEIVFNAPTTTSNLQTQVESLQTTLASLNQQIIILQETLQERDQEIEHLKMKLAQYNQVIPPSPDDIMPSEAELRTDNTLTIIGAVIKIYRFLFPPGKVE